MPSFPSSKHALLPLAFSVFAAACGGDEEPPVTGPDNIIAADGAIPDSSTGDASYVWPDASYGGDAGVFGDASLQADAQVDGGKGDAGADAGPPKPKPKCVKKDSQVMIIGDSYINWISHKFPEQIKTVTQQNWRMLAIGGYAMGGGGLGLIPNQFYDSIAADPDAHTVLMDGGGNDILVPDFFLDLGGKVTGKCKEAGSSMDPVCQEIVKKALDGARVFMDKAVTKGIRDVVYFFYPHVPEDRLIGGPRPNEILDYALPMVEDFCNGVETNTSGKMRCHFINMIPVFKGHTPGKDGLMAGAPADWFNGDIHPNEKGSQGMVDHIWKFMQERCIGQKNKDCCEP